MFWIGDEEEEEEDVERNEEDGAKEAEGAKEEEGEAGNAEKNEPGRTCSDAVAGVAEARKESSEDGSSSSSAVCRGKEEICIVDPLFVWGWRLRLMRVGRNLGVSFRLVSFSFGGSRPG